MTPNKTWDWLRTPENYKSDNNNGWIYKTPEGEWVAKVRVNGQWYKLKETYASAETAMRAVERTWKREMGG